MISAERRQEIIDAYDGQEPMRAAARAARDAMRQEFHEKWGFFYKCFGVTKSGQFCGHRLTPYLASAGYCPHCGSTDIREHRYSPPPAVPHEPM